MNPNLRATLDPAVLAAWSRQLSAWRRKRRYVQPALLLAVIVSTVCVVFFKLTELVFTPFVFGFALVLANLGENYALTCPHCGENPVGLFSRGSILTIDYCEHCRYWLRDPHGDGMNPGKL